MKISSILFVLICTSGLIACQSDEVEFEEVSTAKTPDSIRTNITDTAAVTPLPALPGQQLALPQIPTSLPVQAGQVPTVNPAHGLPYHDCTIAVGAPLVNAGNPVKQPLPPMSPTLPSLQSAPAGVKLNPAHGKPGHRCEIAVGAPLS